MPLISDLDKKNIEKTKIFKKKAYRPWDNDLSDYTTITPVKEIDDEKFLPEDKDNKKNLADDELDNEIAKVSSASVPLFSNQSLELNLEKELRNLYGAQRIIIKYLLNQIEETANEYVITENISMEEFVSACNLPPNTIKGMLQKLKLKKLLESYENKPGRGGYARYKFAMEIYTFFSKKLNTNS